MISWIINTPKWHDTNCRFYMVLRGVSYTQMLRPVWYHIILHFLPSVFCCVSWVRTWVRINHSHVLGLQNEAKRVHGLQAQHNSPPILNSKSTVFGFGFLTLWNRKNSTYDPPLATMSTSGCLVFVLEDSTLAIHLIMTGQPTNPPRNNRPY